MLVQYAGKGAAFASVPCFCIKKHSFLCTSTDLELRYVILAHNDAVTACMCQNLFLLFVLDAPCAMIISENETYVCTHFELSARFGKLTARAYGLLCYELLHHGRLTAEMFPFGLQPAALESSVECMPRDMA